MVYNRLKFTILQLAILNGLLVSAMSYCDQPEWDRFDDQSSAGASRYHGPVSVKECLEYCSQANGCVAADIQMTVFPPGCWLHYNANRLSANNTYILPGTVQYKRASTCSNSTAGGCVQTNWEKYVGYSALGAKEYKGPRTIQQCLDYCERTTSCVGVDIDVNKVPLVCWPHHHVDDLHLDNVYEQKGTNHYRLIDRCPNATIAAGKVCYNPEWSIHEDQNALGATQYPSIQSVQECLDYCGRNRTDCVAVDVDLTQDPPTCWLHFSSADLIDENVYQQPGTNQYRLVSPCANVPSTGPDCIQSSWTKHRGQTALGGILYVGPRTIQQCLDYCNATADCVGVDIDVNLVPIRCWKHTNASHLIPSNIYSQRGTDQFHLLSRCFNAPNAGACYNPEWTVYKDQNALGASRYDAAMSVQECLDHCGNSRTDCVAVDVDLTQDPPVCWLHYSDSDLNDDNVYHQPGTNQYRLVTRCAQGPLTDSTSIAQSTTTTKFDCELSSWTRHRGQAALGGILYAGPRTIQQCLDYCNATEDCVGVDIDVNLVPLKCWIHADGSDIDPSNIYSQRGTDYFELVSRCFNPSTGNSCYNPEWSVYENQNALGAIQYDAVQSVQECLDYCGANGTDCVAVDVDLTQDPPRCWLHLSDDDLKDNNVYYQPGTNQYRLINRCANGPITVSGASSTLSTLSSMTINDDLVIGLAVGLGVPLFIMCVLVLLLLYCLIRHHRVRPVEAINKFYQWPNKTIGGTTSKQGTINSVLKSADGDYDVPATDNHYSMEP